MNKEEFKSIEGRVWLNIPMPTDPFARRTYELISDVEYTDEEKKVAHIPTRFEITRYASVDFDINRGRGKNDNVYVWPEGQRVGITPRDVSQAKIAKRLPKSFYRHVFDTIFVIKKGRIIR